MPFPRIGSGPAGCLEPESGVCQREETEGVQEESGRLLVRRWRVRYGNVIVEHIIRPRARDIPVYKANKQYIH